MKRRFATLVFPALVLLSAAGPSGAQEAESPDLDRVVRDLLPEHWKADRETVRNLDRVMPGVRSYFCRLPALGGAPYERIVVSSEGRVLDRTEGGVFLRRAQAERIEARREGRSWTVSEGASAGARPLLEAWSELAPDAGADAGGALTAALVLLDLLTVKGRFLAASVSAGEAGIEVAVDWRQGHGTWSFEERATWTLRFDRSGALAALGKTRTEFEKHLRK